MVDFAELLPHCTDILLTLGLFWAIGFVESDGFFIVFLKGLVIWIQVKDSNFGTVVYEAFYCSSSNTARTATNFQQVWLL